jgi:hypothetical protein
MPERAIASNAKSKLSSTKGLLRARKRTGKYCAGRISAPDIRHNAFGCALILDDANIGLSINLSCPAFMAGRDGVPE